MPNEYKATFKGRKIGADGIFYHITDTCVGRDEEEARLDLYNKWEHISGLVLVPIVRNSEHPGLSG